MPDRRPAIAAVAVLALCAAGPLRAEEEASPSPASSGEQGSPSPAGSGERASHSAGCFGEQGSPSSGASRERDSPSTEGTGEQGELADRDRLLPSLGALLPGILLHGAGHWIADDEPAAAKLLALEGVGLLGAAAGLVPIYLSGASRYLVGPCYALTLGGAGLFLQSGMADLWGAASAGHALGEPERSQARIEAMIGYAWVHDPQFDHDHFLHFQAVLRRGRLAISPSVWVAADADNQRFRLEASFRFWGPAAGSRARDGSFVQLALGATHHRYGGDGFEVLGAELFVSGRLDLSRLGQSMRGAFAELGLGYAHELYAYRSSPAHDDASMLLAQLGFGLYLGEPGQAWGELALRYEHRNDGLAGGMAVGWMTDGIPGHPALEGFFYPCRSWGLGIELHAGSAWILGASLRYREDEP
ncbi:MAG: hypothetical protein JXR96_14195 [Deltaproteobacteria bacterium]|nr:hypothetical protein [Deltaproteobacteria bacterium]